MALIECSECKEKISSNAEFCPHCGNPRDKQEALVKEEKNEPKKQEKIKNNKNGKICPECGFCNEKDADFCGKCGNSIDKKTISCPKCGYNNENDVIYCKNCGNNIKGKPVNKGWNFYNSFLTFTFLMSALLGVMLFGSDTFREQLNYVTKIFLFSNWFLATLTISIAVVLFLVALIKDKFSWNNELEHLKHFKLSKIQAGLVFLLSGILILAHVGLDTQRNVIYYFLMLLFTIFFLTMTITTLILNYRKIGVILDGLILVFSIASFVGSAMLFNEAREESGGDIFEELRYYYTSGSRPGDEYRTWGNVLLVLGIILLILFIVLMIIRIVKSQKNKKYA